MFEILKIVFINLLTDKRYRFGMIVILITGLYRFGKFTYFKTIRDLEGSLFVEVMQDGSLHVEYANNNDYYIFSNKYTLPRANGRQKCEPEAYALYKEAVVKEIASNGNITLDVSVDLSHNPFSRKEGIANLSNGVDIFDNLSKAGVIFPKNTTIDWCKVR